MTYVFAQTGPMTVLLRRSAILSVLIGTCMFVGVTLAGGLPLLFLPFAEVFIVAVAASMFWFGSLQFKRGFAMVTSSHLLVKNWMWRQKIPWQDVTSVAIEKLQSKNRLGRFVGGLVWGRDGPRFVKINLRRRLPLRSYVFGVMPTKMLVVYLQEPEKFVQDAQRYLTPVTG